MNSPCLLSPQTAPSNRFGSIDDSVSPLHSHLVATEPATTRLDWGRPGEDTHISLTRSGGSPDPEQLTSVGGHLSAVSTPQHAADLDAWRRGPRYRRLESPTVQMVRRATRTIPGGRSGKTLSNGRRLRAGVRLEKVISEIRHGQSWGPSGGLSDSRETHEITAPATDG